MLRTLALDIANRKNGMASQRYTFYVLQILCSSRWTIALQRTSDKSETTLSFLVKFLENGCKV